MTSTNTVTFLTGDDAHNREEVSRLNEELQAADSEITPTVAMEINGETVQLRFRLAPILKHRGDERRKDFELGTEQISADTEYPVEELLKRVKATIKDYGRNTDDRP